MITTGVLTQTLLRSTNKDHLRRLPAGQVEVLDCSAAVVMELALILIFHGEKHRIAHWN